MICLLFMAVEIVGGILANSLAILTDAAHLMSDIAGFMISIFAIWLGRKKATVEFSYGWHRAEIIGALIITASGLFVIKRQKDLGKID